MEEMFMSISQKDSVVNAIHNVLGSSFDPSIPAREQLSDEQLKAVKQFVVSGIMDGSVDYKKDLEEEEVTRYVSGMVSNHLRKAKELNGGVTYSPQSTGRGSRDAQISELHKLLKTYEEGTEEFNQIMNAIETRKTEIAAEKDSIVKEKKKAKEFSSINLNALPENLKDLASTLMGGFNS